MKYKNYCVRYWAHEQNGGTYYNKTVKAFVTPVLNDCVENSIRWRGKARNEKEAVKKARLANDSVIFRLCSVVEE